MCFFTRAQGRFGWCLHNAHDPTSFLVGAAVGALVGQAISPPHRRLSTRAGQESPLLEGLTMTDLWRTMVPSPHVCEQAVHGVQTLSLQSWRHGPE